MTQEQNDSMQEDMTLQSQKELKEIEEEMARSSGRVQFQNTPMEPSIQTRSRLWFDIVAPVPETINIEDIAHALSNLCRYGGHVNRFYSVAEHSLLMAATASAEHNDPVLSMACLMHDAAEAYLGDVVSPLKVVLGTAYGDIESTVEQTVFSTLVPEVWKMTPAQWELVHEYDKRININETEALMGGALDNWARQRYRKELDLTPAAGRNWKETMGLEPQVAKEKFLNHYYMQKRRIG